MHISLKLDDNQAQLQLVSPHSHVRAALEAALPMLRTQLAESGIQLGQSSISSESFAGQQHSSSQQQQSAHAQHADAFGAEDDIALAVPVSFRLPRAAMAQWISSPNARGSMIIRVFSTLCRGRDTG